MDRAEDSRENGWTRHREEQMRSWLGLTMEQRLEWLESAKEFAAQALGAAYGQSSPGAGQTRKDSR
jgi:hypothetical protein